MFSVEDEPPESSPSSRGFIKSQSRSAGIEPAPRPGLALDQGYGAMGWGATGTKDTQMVQGADRHDVWHAYAQCAVVCVVCIMLVVWSYGGG